MTQPIRSEQLHTLEAPQRLAYEARLAAHVQRFFPEQCAALGDDGLRARLRDGIARAHGQGFTSERDVCQFVDLGFAFGPAFDVELPWARTMLALPEGATPGLRMKRLHAEALTRLPRPKGAPDAR